MYNMHRIRTLANSILSYFPYKFQQYHMHSTWRFVYVYLKTNTNISYNDWLWRLFANKCFESPVQSQSSRSDRVRWIVIPTSPTLLEVG